MNLFLSRRAFVVAALIAGAAFVSFAHAGPPPKAAPPADPDEQVIIPGKKKGAPKAATANTLAALLQRSNMQYETAREASGRTVYRIPVVVEDQKTVVVAYESMLGKTREGQPVRVAVLSAEVASFPGGYQAPAPLYKALAEFNSSIIFGKGQTDDRGVFFTCPFFLRNADVQTLLDHLYMVHFARLELKKRVQPILEE